MLENQFVRFTSNTPTDCMAVPVVFGDHGTDVIMENLSGERDITFTLYKMDGTSVVSEAETVGKKDYVLVNLSGLFEDAQVAPFLSEGECFYIGAAFGPDMVYTNTLRYYKSMDGLSVIQYRCDEDAFGLPFSQVTGRIQATLPILLSKPQYGQEDKTYVKADGKVVVLYSRHYKEWEAETEYIPESWHDKIIAAISCDEVYVNGECVTKSESYEIDWENYTKSECGIKAARATFKMRANTMSRNSNF